MTRSPTPKLDTLIAKDPDLVDRIFEYLLAEFPQIAGPKLEGSMRALRERFGAQEVYVRSQAAQDRRDQADAVLSLFNGRNATEVARRLNISRATVYRLIKQPAKKKSQPSR